jgi:transcriptional regulator with XRE-family HTH domain
MSAVIRFEDVDMPRRIRALLALRGESETKLARRLGVSQPSLSYRMTGRRPFQGACSSYRIAHALGVPVSTLTHGAPWPDVSG